MLKCSKMKVTFIVLALLAISLNAKLAQTTLKTIKASHKADWGKFNECVKRIFNKDKDLRIYVGDHSVPVTAGKIQDSLNDFRERPGSYMDLGNAWTSNDNAQAYAKYCILKAQSTCDIAYATGTNYIQAIRINKTGRDTGDLEYSELFFNNQVYVDSEKQLMYKIDGNEWVTIQPIFSQTSFFRLKICVELE